MSIDKSIRQHYDVPETKKIKGQLHKLAYITDKEAKLLQKSGGVKTKTPEGIFAYPPPGERGGPGSGSEGRSPGGGGGGGNIHRDPPHVTAPTVTKIAPAIDVGFQEALKKTEDARQREQEFIDTGDYDVFADTTLQPGPRIDIKDIMGEVTDPGSMSYDPTYKTPAEIRTLQGTTDSGQFFRPQPVVEKPKSGIGGILKGAAMALIPGLLPAELARAYQIANLGYKYKKGDYNEIETALRSNLNKFGKGSTDVVDGKYVLGDHHPNTKKRTTTTFDGDGNEANRKKTIAEQVTQGAGLEEGQKMLGLNDKQIQQIYQGRDLLKQTIESGMYQDRKLNMNEIKMLQQHMMKMENLIQNIESYQVRSGSAHGGFIDQPFTGRSRDI